MTFAAAVVASVAYAGAAYSQTSFRGANIGMTAAETIQQANAIGFHAVLSKDTSWYGAQIKILNKSNSLCALFRLDVAWNHDWDKYFNEIGDPINNLMSISNLYSEKVYKITAYPCYFDAASVDFNDFIKKFESNYNALNKLEMVRFPSEMFGYVDKGSLILNGGEEVEITMYPPPDKEFLMVISKASSTQLDSAKQKNPKF